MSLDRDYQARNVYNVQTSSNEIGRIIDKSIEDVMVNIHKLQSKRKISPEKYGESLRRNKAVLAELDSFREGLQNQTDNLMVERQSYAWDIAEEKNDKLTRDFLSVKTIPSEFDRLPVSALESYLVRKTDGIPLSSRLWNMSGSTRNILEDWIGTGITQGKSANRMAREAVEMMQNPLGATYEINGEKLKFSSFSDTLRATPKKGQYKNPYDAFKRVARNETNFAYRNADQARIDNLDFVVGKEVHLSNAHKSYDVCDNLAGKYPKTFIFNAWHLNCLCYVTTILATKDEFAQGVKSKNTIDRMPVGAERLAKTMAADPTQIKGTSSFTQMDWYKKNFNSKGEPLVNNRPYLEPYANDKDLTYEPNSENYLRNARKGL